MVSTPIQRICQILIPRLKCYDISFSELSTLLNDRLKFTQYRLVEMAKQSVRLSYETQVPPSSILQAGSLVEALGNVNDCWC